MDPSWVNFVSFLTIYALAIVSPGPNFVLVVNSALCDSRRTGIFTSLGVATGSGLFGFAGLAGLLVLINSLPNFAVLIRLIGGGYLVWLGLGSLHQSFRRFEKKEESLSSFRSAKDSLSAWRTGLFTNLTNPKAWAFYFALFTVVITPGFHLWQKALINASMFIISFGWYAFVALMISSPRFRPQFQKVQPFVEFLLGLLLLVLGGRMFLVT